MNGHFRITAAAVCSSESRNCVKAAHAAVENASDARARWVLSDDGPAMITGIESHFYENEKDGQRGSCGVHLTENEMAAKKTKLKTRQNYLIFKAHINRCKTITSPMNKVAIAAVIAEWRKRGERQCGLVS